MKIEMRIEIQLHNPMDEAVIQWLSKTLVSHVSHAIQMIHCSDMPGSMDSQKDPEGSHIIPNSTEHGFLVIIM